MTSVTIASGIICLLFWIGYFATDVEARQDCSRKTLIISYLAGRIVPVLIYQNRNKQTWINLGMELLIFLLLYVYYKNKTVLQYYLFQPVTILAVLSGQRYALLLLLAVVMLCYLAERKMSAKGIPLSRFRTELAVMSGSAYVMVAAYSGKKMQVLVYAMQLLFILAVLHGVWKLKSSKSEDADSGNSVDKKEDSKKEIPVYNAEKTNAVKWQKKDWICMIALTAIFAVLTLYRLGSFKAPQTYQDFQVPDQNEIVLSFQKTVKISKIEVYLGYQGKREISFSYQKPGEKNWTVFDQDHVVESVFKWNEVAVDQPVTALGMVLQKETARIHEIVCLDENGKKVLPANYKDYLKLFDEQKLYPTEGTQYENTMFDEVYHARTAYEFLHKLSIYENTHPPLGKILISFGIAVCGMTPFGFRIVCALAGILMIPLMYLWARKLFENTESATFVTVLVETMFMNLSLARIATLDILVALFVVGMFTCMYGYAKALSRGERIGRQYLWLLFSGAFMAAAVATKWTGIYAAAGLAVWFFVILYDNGLLKDWKEHSRELCKLAIWCVLCFIVIPGMVYLLSYIPFARVYTDKGLLGNAISNAQLMLSYHSKTVFEHPYASEWYEWLIDKRPLLDAYHTYKDGAISTVSTFLNPLLCFGGLFAAVHQYYLVKKYRDRNAKYLGICYLSVMLPWLFIYRTVFIYQYFLGALILPFMIANSFRYMKHTRRKMILTGAVSVALFLLFYPVLTGIKIPYNYAHQFLQWTENWVFTL